MTACITFGVSDLIPAEEKVTKAQLLLNACTFFSALKTGCDCRMVRAIVGQQLATRQNSYSFAANGNAILSFLSLIELY